MKELTNEQIAQAIEDFGPYPWGKTSLGDAAMIARIAIQADRALNAPADRTYEQEPVAWAVPCSRACADGSMEDGPVQFVDHASSGEYSKRIGIPLYTHPAPSLTELRDKVKELPDYRGVSWAVNRNDVLALIDKMGGTV